MFYKRHDSCRFIKRAICAGLAASAWSGLTAHAQTTIEFGATTTQTSNEKGDTDQGFSLDQKRSVPQSGFSFRNVPSIEEASSLQSSASADTAPSFAQKELIGSESEASAWEVPKTAKRTSPTSSDRLTPLTPVANPIGFEALGNGKPGDAAFRILEENKPTPQTTMLEPNASDFEPVHQQPNDGKIALVAFTQEPSALPLEGRVAQAEQGNGQPMGVLKPNDANGIQGLKGEVKIFIDPVTGQVTLIGDDEDTKLVADAFEDLKKQTPKANAERILLNNIASEEIAETVQEIYDANYSSSQGQAFVRPLRSPNGLYVFGTKEAIESIRSIVEKSRILVTLIWRFEDGLNIITLNRSLRSSTCWLLAIGRELQLTIFVSTTWAPNQLGFCLSCCRRRRKT
jgi:hypothetical protein